MTIWYSKAIDMGLTNPEISIVVPVYNEEAALPELVSRLIEVLEEITSSHEIVFVNDGSTDATLAALKRLQRECPTIVIVDLAKNYGQTSALAAGIDTAKGEIIVTMDGDLQHVPEEIPRFVEKIKEGYDVVSGWRSTRTDNYMLRRIPSKCANFLARKLTGVQVKDFGSTFKAYRANLIKKIDLFGELHRFIPVLAHTFGARIVEIPIEVHPRTTGVSNYGLFRTVGVLEDIFFLEFYTHYLTKPIRAFGKLFLGFFGPGLLISLSLVVLWYSGIVGPLRGHGALLLFSVFLMIVGVQFLVVGILAELLVRIYLNTRGSKIYSIRDTFRSES